jgi:hypothetical protein
VGFVIMQHLSLDLWQKEISISDSVYKGWAIKSSPCIATFNDLLCFPLVIVCILNEVVILFV